MRTYSVTKQKAEIIKNHTCCDFYQKKLFILEIIYFLVLSSKDHDQKHNVCISHIPFMILQMKPSVRV